MPAHVLVVRRRRARRARLRLLPLSNRKPHECPVPKLALETTEIDTSGDPTWYRDAVIYQCNVKAFVDSNGDGVGDFQGLTQQARLREGPGRQHAVADALLPRRRCATTATTSRPTRTCIRSTARLQDFKRHARGGAQARAARGHRTGHQPHLGRTIRGSRRARMAPPGSPERDFYVWSDTDQLYQGTRIIFTDTEKSNWTWDPVAKAVLLAPLLQPPAGPQLRQPAGARGGVPHHALLARHGGRRLPARRHSLPDRARRHLATRTCPRRTRSSRPCGRRSTPTTRTASCWPRPTCGRKTCASISAMATSATWPITSR